MTEPARRPAAPSLSIHLRNFSPEDPGTWEPLLARARAADAAGVDRVVVSDHVMFGDDLTAYGDPARGGTAGGRQPTGPDGHWLEPLTLLSVIAGQTGHVRLHTAILLAALRRPVVLAKQLATLDVLSNGRLDIGVGVGWQRAEYEACGLDYSRRGSILDDTLEVLGTLWNEPVAAVDNGVARFADVHAMPKPRQRGGVPLWVSGTMNDRVIERALRFGSGWIPWGVDATDPVPALERLRHAFDAAGRTMDGFEVSGTLPIVRGDRRAVDLGATMDPLPALVDAGVTDVRLHLDVPDDQDAATAFLRPVVETFRGVVGRASHRSGTIRDSEGG